MISEAELVNHQHTLYSSRNPTRRWLHCTRREWISEALGRYSSKAGGKALEIGPGSGIYTSILVTLYDEVTCGDIEITYLKHLNPLVKAYPNLNLIVDDITDSKMPDAAFDLILCSEVVEHIPDSTAAFKEMRRILKADGILLLSTPQLWSTLELAAKIAFMPGIIEVVRLIYRESIVETGHINLMTDKKIIRQLELAGFTILERFKSGIYLPLIAELMGDRGLRIQQWLETKLRDGPLDFLLWTQYYVAKA